MEDKLLGLFCSATDWTTLGHSKSICKVPHRKIPRPGLMMGGAGDILETFLSPLRSCPTYPGLYGRIQGPVAVEPLHSDMGNATPMVLTVLSGLHPVPLPSVWKRKKQIWQLSCQSSSCQVGGRGNQCSQISSLEEPSIGGMLFNNYIFLLPVTRSGLSFCWRSFSYGQRPDHRKDLV